MKRIFIGGCSRSGTTFLQELLANHPRVQTFPETGVFLKALGMRGRVLPWVHLGLTLGKERKALARLLEEMGLPPERCPPLPPRRFSLSRSARDVAAFLDALAKQEGKDVWLEKTPRHVLHAARIRRMVPGSVFVHMVRDGRDVVASIVDRARRFPTAFPRQDDPAYGILQWNRSLEATRAAMKEPGHVAVLYEDLAAHPEKTLRSLCGALGLDFREAMLDRKGPRTFVTEKEGWKGQTGGPIRPAPSKFPRLFGETEQRRIRSRLNMGVYETLKERIQQNPGSVRVSR